MNTSIQLVNELIKKSAGSINSFPYNRLKTALGRVLFFS